MIKTMIREATTDDVADIIVLLNIGAEEYPIYGRYGFNIEKTARSLFRIIESPTDFVFVADGQDGSVVGLIVGVVYEFGFCDATFGTDLVLYVHPDHRNGAIGLRLWDGFMKRMHELDVNEIRSGSTVGGDSTSIERLLVRNGFEKRGVLYDKVLKEK